MQWFRQTSKKCSGTICIKCRHVHQSGAHARTNSVKEKESESERAGRERAERERARARDGEVRGTDRVGERVEEGARGDPLMREGEWGKEGRVKVREREREAVKPYLAVDRQDPLSHCKHAGSGWGDGEGGTEIQRYREIQRRRTEEYM